MSEHGGGDDNIFIPFYDAEKLETEGDYNAAFNNYTKFILDVHNCFANLEESYFKKELREKVAKSYNNRGLIKYKQVDFPGAVEDYTDALKHHKSMYPAYYNRGLVHYRLGNYDESISDCESALAIFPSFEPAQHCLNQAKTDKEKKEQRNLGEECGESGTNESRTVTVETDHVVQNGDV